MCYNFAAESCHANKVCSILSSRKAQFVYTENEILFAFEAPLAVGATYVVRLRLIGKLVVDFLLVIIELFSLRAFVLSQSTRLTD